MRGLFVLIVVIAVCFLGLQYFKSEKAGNAPAQPAATGSSSAGTGASATLDMAAIEPRLKAAAEKIGVTVTKVEPKDPGSAVVTVVWTGDVASLGGDFVSEVVIAQKIARDFDPVKVDQPMWIDAQGARHYRGAYDLKF
jgi:hypothetical protein